MSKATLPDGTKTVTSLHNLPKEAIHPWRNAGNTTRIVDHIIQLLFAGHRVLVTDHTPFDAMHKRTASIVLKRLSIEHPRVKYNYDPSTFAIQLIL